VQPERPETPASEVERFVTSLAPPERMLIVLKRELYEGDWAAMVKDLHARLEGRPYVFKLAHRIEDDLRRIERLSAFERLHQVDLARYVNLDEP
jgi:predicted deacylase